MEEGFQNDGLALIQNSRPASSPGQGQVCLGQPEVQSSCFFQVFCQSIGMGAQLLAQVLSDKGLFLPLPGDQLTSPGLKDLFVMTLVLHLPFKLSSFLSKGCQAV